MPAARRRDAKRAPPGDVALVTIGASAGGIGVLTTIASSLSPDFSGAVLVVLHLSPSRPSRLPEIVDRAGPLPCRSARDGDPIQGGRILVAGTPGDVARAPGSATGPWLADHLDLAG